MATATVTQADLVDSVELPEIVAPSNKGTPTAVNEAEQESGLDTATLLKLISAGFSFFVAGVSDGSFGALVPYVIRNYSITTAIVSSVYGANLLGWLFAAISNTHLCQYLNIGAMLVLGAVLQIAAQALRVWLAPFGLYAFTFWLTSVGQAYQDTHANTFVASAAKGAHRWLAFIHAMYMAGSLVGPFASSAIASSSSPSRWYLFYMVPLGLGVVNLALVVIAFRDSILLIPRSPAASTENVTNSESTARNKGAITLIRDTLRLPSVWLLSLFFFFYLGVVITASGWVVEYLVVVRNGDLAQMGYVPAGFSGGCLLGRILLPEPTHRWGERRMVFIYCLLCILLQLLFWLVPNIIAASVAISLVGFFSGPFFATAISVGTKLFPADISSTAISFVFVFAQIGGSLFPILTGVLASHIGVRVLQPVLVGLISATAISWLLVPQPKSTGNTALHLE